MAELKSYDVVVNGYKTTFQYSDQDAKRLGLTGKDTKSVAAKQRDAKAKADAEAAAKKAADDKAAADAAAAAEKAAADKAKTDGAKAAPATANKATTAQSNK